MESTGWASHVETLIRCVVDRRVDCPTMPTVFSPLSLARKLSGDRLNYDLAENPQAVTDALEAITETVLAFADACFREGAEGFFYSVQAASAAFHTEEEYRRFGEPYDRRILEAVRPKSKLTVLHCHGERLMFDRLAALPADAWNWDDRRAGPPIDDGKARVPGAVIGGLDQWTTLKEGPPEQAVARGPGRDPADRRTRPHPGRGLRARQQHVGPGARRGDQVRRRPREARSRSSPSEEPGRDGVGGRGGPRPRRRAPGAGHRPRPVPGGAGDPLHVRVPDGREQPPAASESRRRRLRRQGPAALCWPPPTASSAR